MVAVNKEDLMFIVEEMFAEYGIEFYDEIYHV